MMHPIFSNEKNLDMPREKEMLLQRQVNAHLKIWNRKKGTSY